MVQAKMVLTRSQARMLIKQGDVLCNGEKVSKPGQLVSSNDKIEIKETKLYVSRGAYKLLKAIEVFNIEIKDKTVMDCGASTGGFTQVCLEAGALKVYALDVGHDQLSDYVKFNERVINREGVNLKFSFEIDDVADLFVMDLSFISIKLVIDNIRENLREGGVGVLLIKPQFEVGKDKLGKNGIVKESDALSCANEVKDWLGSKFKSVSELIESPIKGKTGNTEYLVKVCN